MGFHDVIKDMGELRPVDKQEKEWVQSLLFEAWRVGLV